MITAQQQRVPALRFKDEDGGDYPDWEMKKLDHVGDIVGGGTPSTGKRSLWDGDINWFTPTEIKTKYATGSIRKITSEGIAQSSAALLPVGTILFTSRATIGEVSIAREVCTTNQGFQSFIVNDSMFSNEYLYYWLLANKKHFLRRANGSTFLEISKSEIKKIPLCVPDIREQQKIAAFLSAVDTKIEQLSRKQSLLEQYKQGMMQKLFSQAIRFKDEDGRDYPDWEEKKLADVSEIKTGESNRTDSDLTGKYAFFDRSKDARASDRYLFDCEAVIVAGEGQEFVPRYFVGKFDLHQRSYAIMNFTAVVGKYIFFVMSQKNAYFLSQAVGSTVKSLRLPMFKNMPLDLPCVKEQQKIANFLSAIDRKIELVAKQVEQARFFKQGLLQQMFI